MVSRTPATSTVSTTSRVRNNVSSAQRHREPCLTRPCANTPVQTRLSLTAWAQTGAVAAPRTRATSPMQPADMRDTAGDVNTAGARRGAEAAAAPTDAVAPRI